MNSLNFWDENSVFVYRSEEAWCSNCGTVSSDGECHCTGPDSICKPDWHPADKEMMDELTSLRSENEKMRAASNKARIALDRILCHLTDIPAYGGERCSYHSLTISGDAVLAARAARENLRLGQASITGSQTEEPSSATRTDQRNGGQHDTQT